MQSAKLFMNGQSQAVRLPKEYRLKGKEVFIKKVGNIIMLIPPDHIWDSFVEGLEEFTPDCFGKPRLQPAQKSRERFDE